MHFIEEDSIIVGRACPAVVILGVCAWVFLVYGRAFFFVGRPAVDRYSWMCKSAEKLVPRSHVKMLVARLKAASS